MLLDVLPLTGAFKIRLDTQADERGFFARRFCAATFADHGLETDFVQRSVSYNARRGTLRGLHFQAPPHAETKIVRCTRGSIFDVIVDLRAKSPTFGRWHAETLTADNHIALYVPKGFAHGFQTLEDVTEIDYEITPAYVPGFARGVRFDDKELGIEWPISSAILSDRDRNLPGLRGLR
ncbi:dTDP-4-dehydrorhamnose 3,5-epimerase [Bosea vaviloviae]|uniref:dTDP-4-dehydrorhamnose 3,5-epimerase n=1 Tax=Bosea vaviloviae TaxID=1526658 RepID=A0A1D7TZ38_9HYPH|nr:dTDP-4-dehydrorhamnose 3,5-epimerase [Bosea vaviloviae]AOO80387.1 dTDP-4-dehydrorhamnose 3,5-epimerase [Bosea vaviloviae]